MTCTIVIKEVSFRKLLSNDKPAANVCHGGRLVGPINVALKWPHIGKRLSVKT